MNIVIVGASGFLGTHLMKHLLETTNNQIVALSRHASAISFDRQFANRVTLVDADVFDEEQMTEALVGADVAYYFVHMMGQKNKDFYTQETISAHRFSAAAIAAGVRRVIFMGGLGNDHDQLSTHLLSRHNTGTVLRENLPLVIELRASMIIGKGSISYDIIENLVHKLPLMTLPRWSITLTQPIALRDALEYLTQAATVKVMHHEIIEIGGPDVVSYKDLYKLYANSIGRHPLIVRLPFLPEWLGGWWLNLFTPYNHAKIGRIMVHSMSNAMIVTHARSAELFPQIHPIGAAEAIIDTQ
jgi:uncharacterized protein YbjT (DUF2867 family)